MRRRLPLALALAALLAGCGGEEATQEGAAATPTPRPSAEAAKTISPQEWSQRVVRLCKANKRQAERAVARLTKRAQTENQSQTEFAARVLDYSAEAGRPLVDRLAALPLPEGRSKEAERFVTLIKGTLPLLEDSAKAIRDGDRAESTRINRELRDTAQPARQLARDLGIEACNTMGGG